MCAGAGASLAFVGDGEVSFHYVKCKVHHCSLLNVLCAVLCHWHRATGSRLISSTVANALC
jgi:hypothetical protein